MLISLQMSRHRTNFSCEECPNLLFCVSIRIKAKTLSSDLLEHSFFHRLAAELNLEIVRYDVVAFLQFVFFNIMTDSFLDTK